MSENMDPGMMPMPMPDMPVLVPTVPSASTAATLPVVQSGITPWRNGCYTGETIATSEAIQKRGWKLLWECDLTGSVTGSQHQPLVVPAVTMRDGLKQDCLFIASMSNDVFCFDAANPDPVTGRGREIWKQRIGNPIINNTKEDMYMEARPYWGALSCPYIDLNTQTMYVVCFSSPTQQFTDAKYYLHALNITDGSARCAPLDISTGVVYQSPGGPIAHDAAIRKQRSGLAFFSYNDGTHDVIFVCDSTFAMMSDLAHGFMVACDVTGVRTGGAMKVACAWTASAPPYAGTGIWMAGQAPALNEVGDLFVECANGAFDPTKGCYGNACVKLHYTPPTATETASITPMTHWAGYSDAGRDGYDPTIPWIGLVPNYSNATDFHDQVARYDADLGSAGAAYIPKSVSGFTDNLIVPCGKDGVAYGLNADAMGDTQIGDFAPDKIQANWAKCLFVTGATYYPGDFDITPTDLSKDFTTPFGVTVHCHNTPPWFVSNDHQLMIFFSGENAPVRAFNITQDAETKKYSINYLGTGDVVASPNMAPPGGMAGAQCQMACNGNVPNTSALHCLFPLGDSNKGIVPGRYVIYGSNWIANGELVKLWDSGAYQEIQYSHCGFGRPTPALGKSFVPTSEAKVLVFGLPN